MMESHLFDFQKMDLSCESEVTLHLTIPELKRTAISIKELFDNGSFDNDESDEHFTLIKKYYLKKNKIDLPWTSLNDLEIFIKVQEVKESIKEPELPRPAVTLYPADNVILGWKPETRIVSVGLINMGCACFLNSTLQALFHLPAFVNWLSAEEYHEETIMEDGTIVKCDCIICVVLFTLNRYLKRKRMPFKPIRVHQKLMDICSTMSFGVQEDAHEFLRCLLDGMERIYLARREATNLDIHSKATTPINQIFGGYIRTELQCQMCGQISTTFHNFQELNLEIQPEDSIDSALERFFDPEEIEGYNCEKCKDKVTACKRFYIEQAPKVLCIQLSRFDMFKNKLRFSVRNQMYLDISPYKKSKPRDVENLYEDEFDEEPTEERYRFASQINHQGISNHFGHYTAMANIGREDPEFVEFNDENVYEVDAAMIEGYNWTNYVLFYEMDLNTWPTVSEQERDCDVSDELSNLEYLKSELDPKMTKTGSTTQYPKKQKVIREKLSPYSRPEQRAFEKLARKLAWGHAAAPPPPHLPSSSSSSASSGSDEDIGIARSHSNSSTETQQASLTIYDIFNTHFETEGKLIVSEDDEAFDEAPAKLFEIHEDDNETELTRLESLKKEETTKKSLDSEFEKDSSERQKSEPEENWCDGVEKISLL